MLKQTALPLTLALALASSQALAQAAPTGDLGFEGLIEGGTCDLAMADVNRTIELKPIRTTEFDGGNSVAPEPFELTAECDDDVSSVHFTFSGTSSSDGVRFQNTGSSGGVGLWLYDRFTIGDATIPANGSEEQRRRTVVTSDGRAVLPLGAAYWRTGAVTEGTLESEVTVEIAYD